MISKKYAADYRLENVRDKQGRLKTVAVYRGTRYTFKASPQAVRRAAVLFAFFTALSILCFGTALFLNTEVLHRFYVLFPFLGCLLPLGYLSIAVFYIFTATPPFTRERRDKICDRTAYTTILLMIFSGLSAVGATLSCVFHDAPFDWQAAIYFTAVCGLFASAAIMHRRKHCFDTVAV